MDTDFNAQTGEEDVIVPTYVEAFGLREELFGFNTSVGGDVYSLNLDFGTTDEFVKKLADAFLNQVEVELKIIEGPVTMVWEKVMVDAMYGFRSFGCTSSTKPAMQ